MTGPTISPSDTSSSGTTGPEASRSGRRGLWFAGLGVVLAAALVAVVLSVHGGSGTASGGTAATGTLPGISPASAALLSLSPLPGTGEVAKDFHLTDQRGQPVSLSQFRGSSVVLSFNDDRCTDVCTLLAEDVVRADQFLGAAGRSHVVFLSVNVNPFFPAPAATKEWTDQNGLGAVANWYFATGPVPTLQAVWKDYGVYVGADPKTQSVTHGTLIEYIDPEGRIRAAGDFGQNAVDVDPYSHGLAQAAVDLLPAAQRPAVAGPQAPAGGGTGAGLGQQAPLFDLAVLADPATKLSLVGERGQPVVLNFWASTCVNCRSELKAFAQVATQDPKIHFIGVDVADPSSAAATALLHSAGAAYPTVVDSGGQTAARYQVAGLPTTVYIDETGKIAVVHPGAMTAEQLTYTLGQFFPNFVPSGP
ncbi:MAG: redoxin domain-containing protein [Acidobacteriota bacterium]|nr:redoxin domain-containing protein [Acidobacteriota bacterium]